MANLKDATKSLHSGHDVKATAGTRAVPIYQTSSYVFENAEHAKFSKPPVRRSTQD